MRAAFDPASQNKGRSFPGRAPAASLSQRLEEVLQAQEPAAWHFLHVHLSCSSADDFFGLREARPASQEAGGAHTRAGHRHFLWRRWADCLPVSRALHEIRRADDGGHSGRAGAARVELEQAIPESDPARGPLRHPGDVRRRVADLQRNEISS